MPRYADLILLPRGVINPGGPSGEGLAVAVAEGRIMAFGDAAALAPLRGPGAEVIRSAAWLLPAFRDAHLHLCGLGEALSTLQLQGLNLDALLHAVATAPGEGWLWGRGWDETRWPTRFLPALSAAAPKRPVALTRIDGHALWINRALLDLLGLNAATPDPPGGWLSRDALGQPTGLLVDNAMALVPRPAPSAEALGGFIQRATDHLLSLGVVAACDMGASPPELEAILRAAPPLRLEVYLDAARGIEIRAPLRQGDVWARGVKLFADGALGSRGAWLRAPYADAPGRGLALLSPSALRDAAQAHRARGFDLAIHAIGDAAASAVLDLYEALDLRGGRLEHAQLLSEPDLDRLARSGTVASIQPLHYVDDAEMAPRRLGPERFAQAYPWRRLVARGAPILLGSDAPIASADPRRGLWAALSRSDGEALSPTTALRAYTVGPLRPGDPADLILWGVNPLTAPPSALLDAPLEGVWVGGARRG